MRVPKYIKDKMHQIAALSHKSGELSREVDAWFISKGFEIEDIRSGDGCTLEELGYGVDITNEFCERIESGCYYSHRKEVADG
jgi:hypothetical protein